MRGRKLRKIRVTLDQSAPTLYYVCAIHSGMGGNIIETTTKRYEKTTDSFWQSIRRRLVGR